MTDTFVIERATTIAAPETVLRPLIDDFRRWRDWSPWEDADPELRRLYSGPETGAGAHYDWEGNRKAGAGSMTVITSEPGRVTIDLEFQKPFKNRNDVAFLLEPAGAGTTVTWRMSGTKNLFLKLFGFLFPMEKFVGPDFEKGLARLKALAEGN